MTLSDTRVEMLKARITLTDTGWPAQLKIAQKAGAVAVAPEGPPWYWIACGLVSAERMRRNGLKAVGTLATTWFPPQAPDGTIDPDAEEPEGAWLPLYDPVTNEVAMNGAV